MQNEQDEIKLVCFICGRKHPKSNLSKHLKGCERRYKAEQEKKTKQPQKPCPLPPKELQEVLKNQNCPPQKIESYNQKALAKYKSDSQPTCKICQKQFNSEIFSSHEASCSAKPQTPAGDSSDPKRSTSYGFGKPKVLMCPICGREFGLASLKIHHPQCIEKFNNEESKKPKQDRRELPEMAEQLTQMIYEKEDWTMDEIEQFNIQSQKIYRDKGLVKCPNCGRAFFVDSLEKHKKNCKMINGEKNKSPEKGYSMPKEENLSKPRAAMCHICGRQFGTKSLLIHQKQCADKWVNEENKKQKASERRPIPEVPQSIKERFDLNALSSWTNEELDQYNNLISDFYNKKTLVSCPNCKRTFLPQSLVKHLKGCQPKQGMAGPPKPISKDSSSSQQPAQLRKPKTLVCYICGRQFGLSSLKIHQNQCENKYRNQEAKKQIDERKDLPDIDQKYLDMIEDEDWTMDKIQEFNSYMNDLYKNTVLEKCYICGRTFHHEALLKHKTTCVKKDKPPALPDKSAQSSQKKNYSPSKLNLKNFKQEQDDDQEQPSPKKKSGVVPKTDRVQSKQASPQKADTSSTSNNPPRSKSKFKQEVSKEKQEAPEAPKSPQKPPNRQPNKQPEQKKTDTSIIKNLPKKEIDDSQEDDKNIRKSPEKQKQQPKIEKKPTQQKPETSRDKPSSVKENNDKSHTLDRQSVKENKPQSDNPPPEPNAEVVKLDMDKCKFCDRKFEKSRLEKHLTVCPKKVEQAPPSKNSSFAQNSSMIPEAQPEVDLEKCTKCHRKFVKDRLQKHYNICKGTKELESNASSSKRNKTPGPILNPIPVQDTIIQQDPLDDTTNPLVPCCGCGRKFKKDRLQKHESICKDAVNKKSQQSAKKIKAPALAPIPVQDSVIMEQTMEDTMVSLVPCSRCGRKFKQDRLQKHESICKVQPKVPQQQSRSSRGEYKLDKLENMSSIEETAAVQYCECSKCKRKFTKDRLEKHQSICKGRMNENSNTKQQFFAPPKKQEEFESSQSTVPVGGSDQFQQQDLEQCEKCHRKFVKERLDKHKSICKGQPIKHIKIETPLKQNASNVKASEQSKQFMKMISELKGKKKSPQDVQAELDRQVEEMKKSMKDPKLATKGKDMYKPGSNKSSLAGGRGPVRLPEI